MSDQAIGSAAKPVPAQAAVAWLVSAGIYLLLQSVGPRLLNDPDTYSHIAVGRWILAHGALPTTDPFSFSMHGEPWIAFEWLSEVIYAAVFAVAGWNGVVALASATIALAVGLLMRFLLRTLQDVPAFLIVLSVVVLLAPHMLARPHVLALPLMVTWAAALVNCMDRGARPPYWALPLLVLWANLHGSVVLALGLIGPAVLEELIQTSRHDWPGVLRRWLPFTALAILACCLTPYGPGTLLIPLTTAGLGQALNWIGEWRPQDFSHVSAFEVVLLAGLFGLSRGVKLPVVRALVLVGLVFLALTQIRNADLLALLAPLYLAAPLSRQLGGKTEDKVSGQANGLKVAALGVVIAATVLAQIRDVRPPLHNTPEGAIASAGLAHKGPVFNDYAFGGYLVFSGIPSFIDGRGELYGGPLIDRYNRAISLADLNDFIKLLDQYKIEATLLEPSTPAVALLDRLPDWHRVYSDDIAVVHERLAAAKSTF
jgi:hypothetical protein